METTGAFNAAYTSIETGTIIVFVILAVIGIAALFKKVSNNYAD